MKTKRLGGRGNGRESKNVRQRREMEVATLRVLQLSNGPALRAARRSCVIISWLISRS